MNLHANFKEHYVNGPKSNSLNRFR